ncbi:DUF2781 domain-containing protein [Nostoc sp. DSM 114161]|jgi:hypothetical protein|uniref:EXPERA domain-containing protein n=1 Tax=Nostoc sp. DSM 114161 TaxID=3440143 RepID=UPI0040462610
MKQLENIPLQQRPQDWFFIGCFSFFACSSFCISSISAFKIPLSADSPNFLVKALYWYGSAIDPLTLGNPPSLQMQTIIDTFIFGPFYICLNYALIQGANWIRIPALLYISSITYSMVLLIGIELLSSSSPKDFPKFLMFNVPYILIPLLLGYRLRHPLPFAR